jgi:hypothetical protein
MKAAVLSLAAGSEKIVWDVLRDPLTYDNVQPINPTLGSGLMQRDGTQRPSFAAFATMSKLLQDQRYVGPLKLGPDAVALLFGKGKSAHIAVWPLRGRFTLTLNQSGIDPRLPDSLFVASVPNTRVLDSTGKELFGSDGTYQLNGRPVWITDVGHEMETLAKAQENKTLLVQRDLEPKKPGEEVKAQFATAPGTGEEGIAWRKFTTFRGVAQQNVTLDGRSGLKTEYSRNIWNPADAKPFIYLDVADEYLYFERGVPVRVTVDVHRAAPSGDSLNPASSGFCLEYDSAEGAKRTEWKTVEVGEGWTSYSFDLADASFSNRGGFDLLINTFGAKQDIVFGSVTVRRLTDPAAVTTAANPAISPVAGEVR